MSVHHLNRPAGTANQWGTPYIGVFAILVMRRSVQVPFILDSIVRNMVDYPNGHENGKQQTITFTL